MNTKIEENHFEFTLDEGIILHCPRNVGQYKIMIQKEDGTNVMYSATVFDRNTFRIVK
jgi:hypothetical protein